jgi:alpha-ketoglutarate-dependent taurine dioxygenase
MFTASVRFKRGSVTVQSEISVVALTPALGAEVRGLDLRDGLTEEQVERLWSLLLKRQVVFVPDQQLDDKDLVALATRFGSLERSNPIVAGVRDNASEYIYTLDTRGSNDGAAGTGKVPRWHADVTYMEEPPAVSIMNVIALPDVGGDTLFASTAAAYDSLSPAMQRFVNGLTAVHDIAGWTAQADQLRAEVAARGGMVWNGKGELQLEPVEHPVVSIHPDTGRRSLYVDPAATLSIKGLSRLESDAILHLLQAHVTRPEHVVRYSWTPGTIGIWDQRSTLHYAVDDYGTAARAVHRVSIAGNRPVGVAG